jgi:uncharacterized protein with GYD domain
VPHYILLSNLTDDGWKTVREKPDRIKEVNKEIQALGVKVVGRAQLTGQHVSPDQRQAGAHAAQRRGAVAGVTDEGDAPG